MSPARKVTVRVALMFLSAAALGCVVGCSSETTDDCSAAGSALSKLSCASGATFMGIDVSKFQGTIDWGKVKTAGVKYAFIRATDGSTYKDPTFNTNWDAAALHGIPRGSYHFFRAASDGTAQANSFIASLKAAGLNGNELPAVLDLEASGLTGTTPSVAIAGAKKFLLRVEQEFGKRPIVYTGNNVASYVDNQFGGYPLWIAQYTSASCPSIPQGWSKWAFWQSGQITLSGIPDNVVDVNHYNGTLASLSTLGSIGTTVPDAGVAPPSGPSVIEVESGPITLEVRATPEGEGTMGQAGTPSKTYAGSCN